MEQYEGWVPRESMTLGQWTKTLIEHYQKPWYIKITSKWKQRRDELVNMATNYSVGG